MKDRLRAAKRQHIEQLEILSQRALAMRPSGQPLAPAARDPPGQAEPVDGRTGVGHTARWGRQPRLVVCFLNCFSGFFVVFVFFFRFFSPDHSLE